MKLDPNLSVNMQSVEASIQTATSQATPSAQQMTGGKANTIASQVLEFKELARGAAKIIHVPKFEMCLNNEDASKVWLTPVQTFFGGKEKELREEFETMKAIQEATKNDPDSQFLAVQAEELKGDERIASQFTLKSEKASGDFEKTMKKDLSNKQRVDFADHYLKGLKALHASGRAHGDIKAENCLIYGKEPDQTLRLSDFGKTKSLKEEETASYSGNLLHAPPEGKQSQKADTYGAAIDLIRNFEQPYLKKGSLLEVEVDQRDSATITDHHRQGIEKFIVEHKAFPACEAKGWRGFLTRLFRRLFNVGNLKNEELKNHEAALHNYIDALGTKLKESGLKEPEKLIQLLKEMTRSDPNKRISSAEAAQRYGEWANLQN